MNRKNFFVDYLMAIDYFEKKAKRVEIHLTQGIRKKTVQWINKYHLPSLQATLKKKTWFAKKKPNIFFMPGILMDEATRIHFDHNAQRLELDLCGGQIVIQSVTAQAS